MLIREPIKLKSGQKLITKAKRIGYKTSHPVIRWKYSIKLMIIEKQVNNYRKILDTIQQLKIRFIRASLKV